MKSSLFISEVRQWINEMFFLGKMKLKLNMYIKLADYKHYITNKRFFVIPSLYAGLDVICADQIQECKRNGIIRRHDGYLEVSAKAFYQTATQRGGKDAPTIEERMIMRERYNKYARMVRRVNPRIMKKAKATK